ncbi:uncharacterized protein ASPGLDRAFT_50691 [Aspergillus glaucus CBS 516.65]|uniref:Uncharacterized protein n=1 Tax=Aspergillus glaucus CBS 516.65 TaxID=1160497 RepID=A0A1L9VB84_ASPGL|nr:hypothetical protein ASPGLDRAFT_50691 [Aspergillus glaucus CBS 516.65]OJJ81160.1 hypothetical protein ASPGLDRAFT_50691 [Aspergillus glaucus CBS 516.65]
MLAVRDQENLVHAHQTVAAGKPLNQGTKTPGARAPKTPFKVPLNDENGPLAFGKKTVKATGKGNENLKPAKDAFVTPLPENRQRAPLGMKTTNAKAKTPAPIGTSKPERTNRRTSTQKVKKIAPFVQQSEPETAAKSIQDDVPDIEYMPPKPKELPDLPDDIKYDTTFPQFRPENLARGLESTYGNNEVGSDGLTKRERKYKEASIAQDKMMDEMILKQIDSIGFEEANEMEPMKEASKRRIEPRRVKVPTPKVKYSNVSTLRARDAAAALSAPEPSGPRTRAASRPRISSSIHTRKPRAPANPSSMRHSAAVANSKTTVGYSKGREVSTRLHGKPSTTAKQPAPKNILSPDTYMQLYGTPPFGSEMWLRCKAVGCFDDEQSQAETIPEPLPTFGEDDEALNFQLAL